MTALKAPSISYHRQFNLMFRHCVYFMCHNFAHLNSLPHNLRTAVGSIHLLVVWSVYLSIYLSNQILFKSSSKAGSQSVSPQCAMCIIFNKYKQSNNLEYSTHLPQHLLLISTLFLEVQIPLGYILYRRFDTLSHSFMVLCTPYDFMERNRIADFLPYLCCFNIKDSNALANRCHITSQPSRIKL